MTDPLCEMAAALLECRVCAPQLLPECRVAVGEAGEDVAPSELSGRETVCTMFASPRMQRRDGVDSADGENSDHDCSTDVECGCRCGDDCDTCRQPDAVGAADMLASVAEFMPDNRFQEVTVGEAVGVSEFDDSFTPPTLRIPRCVVSNVVVDAHGTNVDADGGAHCDDVVS